MSRRSLVLLLVLVVLGGGALAWFALRDEREPGRAEGGPRFVVKTAERAEILARIQEAELEAIDEAGNAVAQAAVVREIPRGAREASAPLRGDVGRLRVRFRVDRPDGPWHELGPYSVSGWGVGTRVLQVGLVLEAPSAPGVVDLDGIGEAVPAFVARLVVRTRSPSGAESVETFGSLSVR